MEAELEKVTKAQEELAKAIKDAKDKELEVSEAQELSNKALEAMSTQNFSRAQSYLREAQEVIEQSKTRQIAWRLLGIITNIEGKINESKRLGIDVGDSQSLIARAKAHYDGNRLAEAKEYARQAKASIQSMRRTYLSSQMDILISNARRELEDARAMGASVAASDVVLRRAENYRDQGDLQNLERTVKEVSSLVSASVKNHLEHQHKRQSERFATVSSNISSYSAKGIDLTEAHDILAKAKDAIDRADFKASEALLGGAESKAKELLSRTQKNEARALLDEIKSLLSHGERIGANVTRPKVFYTSAIREFDRKDYEQAISSARNALEETKRSISAKETEVHTEVSAILTTIEQEISCARDEGIDVSGPEQVLGSAKAHLQDRDFSKAREEAVRSQEQLELTVREHFKKLTKENLSKLSGLVTQAEKLSADLGQTEDLRKKAKDSMEKKEYKEAKAFAIAALDAVTQAIERRNATLERESTAALTSSYEVLMDARSKEVDISLMSDIFNMAKKAHSQGDFLRAMEMANKTRDDTNRLLEQQQVREVSDQITSIETDLVEAKRIGAETQKLSELINDAKRLRDEKQFERCKDVIIDAQLVFKTALDVRNRELTNQAVSLLQEGRALVVELRDFGIDITLFQDQFDISKQLFEKGDFLPVIDIAQKIIQQGKSQRQRYLTKEVKGMVTQIEAAIDEGTDLGAQMEGVKGDLTKINTVMSVGDLTEALDLGKKALQTAAETLKRRKEELSMESITAIQELRSFLVEMKGIGIDIRAQEDRLADTKTLFDQARFKDVLKLVESIKESASSEKETFFMGQSQSAMNEVKERLTYADGLGIDTTGAKTLLDQARDSLKKKDFDACANRIDEASHLLDGLIEVRKTELRQKCRQRLSTVRDAIIENRNLGIDTTATEEMFRKAQPLFEGEYYFRLIDLTKEIHENLEMEREAHTIDLVKRKVEDVRKLIQEGEGYKMEVGEIEELLGSIEEYLGSKDFQRAQEEVAKAYQLMEERLTTRKRELSQECVDTIQKARDAIVANKELGIDTEDLQKEFERTRPAYDSSDFFQVLEIGRRILERSQEDKEVFLTQRYDDEARSILELIEKGEHLSVDMAPQKEQLEKARAALSDKDFESASSLLADTRKATDSKIATKEEELSNETVDLITDVRDRIASAKEVGVHTEELETSFADVKTLFQGRNFLEAKEKLNEINDRVIRMRSEFFALRYEDLLNDISVVREQTEALKGDFSPVEDLLAQVTSAKESGDLERASGIASRALESGNALIAERKRFLADESVQMLTALRDQLQGLVDIGIDTTPFQEELQEVKELYDGEDYIQLEQKAQKIKERADLTREDHLLGQARISIEEVRTLMEENSRYEIEKQEALSLLEEAESLLQERRFDETASRIDRARTLVMSLLEQKQEEYNQRAIQVITALKTGIQEAKELGARTAEAEEMFQQIKPLFEARDHFAVLSLAQEAEARVAGSVEDFHVEAISREIEEVQDLVVKAEELDLDMSDVKTDLASAQEDVVNKDFDTARTKVSDCREAVKERTETRQAELQQEAVQVLTEFRKTLSQSRDLGVDTETITERVATLKPLFERGAFKEVLSSLEEIEAMHQQAKDEFHVKRYEATKDEVQVLLDRGEDIGADLQEVNDFMGMAQRAIDENDFLKADKASAQALESANEIIAARKEELSKEAVALLTETRTFLDECASSGMDLSDLVSEFAQTKPAFEQERFFDVMTSAKDILEMARLEHKRYYQDRLTGKMKELDDALEEAKGLEVDVVELDKRSQTIGGLIDGEEFQEAEELINDIQTSVVELLTRKKLERFKEAVSKLEEAKSHIRKAKEDQIVIDEALARFAEAKGTMEAKDFLAMEAIASDVVSLVEDARVKAARARFDELVSNIETTIERTRAYQGETGSFEQDLSQIEEKGEGDSLDEATSLAEELLERTTTYFAKRKETLTNETMEKIKGVRSILQELKELEVDTTEAQERFARAKPAVQEEDFIKALEVLEQAREMAWSIKEGYFRNEVDAVLSSIDALKAESEYIGLEITQIDEGLDGILKGMEEGREFEMVYKESNDLLSRLDEMIKEKRKELKGICLAQLKDTKGSFDELKQLDIDVEEARAKYAEAKPSLEKADYPKVLGIIKEVNETLDSLKKEYYTTETSETLEKVDVLIGKAKDLELDVEEEENTIKDIKDSMNRDEVLSARDMASTLLEGLDDRYSTKREEVLSSVKFDMESLEAKIENAKELELDVSHENFLLTKSKTALESDNISQAKDLLSQTMELMREKLSKHYKVEADRAIDEMMDLHSVASELDVDLTEISEDRDLILKMQESEDYHEARDLANETATKLQGAIDARKKVLHKDAVTQLQESKQLMASLKEKQIEITDAKEVFLDAKSKLEEEDYKGVFEVVKKVEEALERSEREHYRGILDQRKETFDRLIDQAKQLDVDAQEFNELMENAEKDCEGGEYEGAIALADTTIASLDEKLEDKRKVVMKDAVEALRSIKELSSSMKEEGIDIEAAMEVFAKARPALTEKDFPTVFSIAEQVNSLLKEARDKHEHDSIATLISETEALFEKADRVEVDVSKQREIIAQVKIALEAKDYEAARKVATEVHTTVKIDIQEKMELLYKDAMEIFNKVKKTRAELDDMGADTSPMDEPMERTKEAFNEKDYADVITICEGMLTSSGTIRTGYKTDRVNSTLEEITQLQGDAVKFSLDMSLIDDLVENSRKQLESGELDEALARSLEAKDTLSAMIEEKTAQQREQAYAALEDAKQAGERAVTMGVEIAGFDERISRISSALGSNDFERAISESKDLEVSITSAIKDAKEAGVQAKIEEVRSLITEADELDIDAGDGPELFERAQDSLSNEDYEGAEANADQAIETLTSALSERRKEALKEAVDTLKTTKVKMAQAKKIGIDITPVKEVFIEAKEYIKDPTTAFKALTIARSTDETLMNISIVFYKDQLKEGLPPIKELLKEASDLDADVESQADAIADIEEAAATDNLERLKEAVERASKTKEALEESIKLQKSSMETRAQESISSSESLLEEIKGMGGTVTEVSSLIDEAKKAFHSGNYRETLSKTGSAKERLKNIRNELLKGTVAEQLETLRTTIETGKKLGADVSPAQERLSKASDAIDGDDFTKAHEILSSAITQANDIIDDRKTELTSSVKRELQKARTMILDAKVAGIDITQAKEYFVAAKDHLKDQEYEKVIELAMKVVSAIEEQGKYFEKDRIRRTIEVARRGVAEGTEMDIDMSEPAVMLDEAEKLLSSGDEEGAQELVTRADEIISANLRSKMEVSITDAKAAVNAAKEKLKSLKAEGANISPAQRAFLEIKELFKQGQHVEAKAKADETMRIALEIEREFKQDLYVKMIEDAQGVVSAASQDGFDLTEANNRITAAYEALEAGNFDEVEQESLAAVKFIEQSRTSQEKRKQFLAKKALNLLKSVRSNILKANEAGTDVSLSTEIFKNAKTSLEEKDYDSAIALAREAESSIGQGLDEQSMVTETEEPTPEEVVATQATGELSQEDIDTMIETLELVSSVIDRARTAGLDVSTAEELEDQAREAYNNKDFQTVILLSNRIREEVERIQTDALEAGDREAPPEGRAQVKVSDALETLKEVQTSMSQIKASGVDITSAEQVFQEVDHSLKQRDFTKAVDLAKKAERMAMLARGEVPEEEEGGEEPAASEEEAEQAPGFEPTVPMPDGTETPQELNRKAMMAIRAAQEAISKAKSSGANVSKAEDAFLDAESALLKKDFTRLIEIASKAERYAFEAKREM